MNIMFIAKSFHGSTTDLIARTIQDMEHTLIWFEFPWSSGRNPSFLDNFSSFVKRNFPVSMRSYVALKNKQILDTARREKPDLILVIKGNYVLPETIQKLRRDMNIDCFLWFYDKTYSLDQTVLRSFREYSRVFLKDRYLLHKLQNSGLSNLAYLPQACAPFLHKPPSSCGSDNTNYNCDISLVGSYYVQREYLFQSLENYQLKIYGVHWDLLPDNSPLRQYWQRKSVESGDAVTVYHRSRINLNSFHFGEIESLNVRTFEITGSGGFLLSEEKEALLEVFEPGKDIATFGSGEDLQDKVRYFLNHEPERNDMAREACRKIHESHTYEHRISRMMEELSLIH